MTGTFTSNTTIIDCPNCDERVLVHVASFSGCGKKCPRCEKIISFDYYAHKLVTTEPAK